MNSSILFVSAALGLLAPAVHADPMTPQQWLERYDAVMSPASFEVEASMTATREDKSTRSYTMHVLKSGSDKLRATFSAPSSAKGQEMLRNGDNLWLYMPSLKRAVRVAARDQFMGGDFNNADVLRPNYAGDYTAVLKPTDDPKVVLLELKARSPQVAYDVVKLWMSNDKEPQPLRSELYAQSGKLLRTAEFLEVRDLGGGWKRPARIVMKNALQPNRSSEMVWKSAARKDSIPAQRFVLDDLGR